MGGLHDIHIHVLGIVLHHLVKTGAGHIRRQEHRAVFKADMQHHGSGVHTMAVILPDVLDKGDLSPAQRHAVTRQQLMMGYAFFIQR